MQKRLESFPHHNEFFYILFFVHFVVPLGISPMGNSGRFPPRKASCNRVALPNPNKLYKVHQLGLFVFHSVWEGPISDGPVHQATAELLAFRAPGATTLIHQENVGVEDGLDASRGRWDGSAGQSCALRHRGRFIAGGEGLISCCFQGDNGRLTSVITTNLV